MGWFCLLVLWLVLLSRKQQRKKKLKRQETNQSYSFLKKEKWCSQGTWNTKCVSIGTITSFCLGNECAHLTLPPPPPPLKLLQVRRIEDLTQEGGWTILSIFMNGWKKLKERSIFNWSVLSERSDVDSMLRFQVVIGN